MALEDMLVTIGKITMQMMRWSIKSSRIFHSLQAWSRHNYNHSHGIFRDSKGYREGNCVYGTADGEDGRDVSREFEWAIDTTYYYSYAFTTNYWNNYTSTRRT